VMADVFVFGVGMDAPSRYSAMSASVKRIFFRRSGVRNADPNALSTGPPAGKLLMAVRVARRSRRPVPTSLLPADARSG
jgi:hypothetical protein